MARHMTPAGIWLMRAAYTGIALTVLFFHLLPLSTEPVRWAPADLLLAMTLAWALRRPEFVPPLLVAAVMFLADLLLQRPPGLWALLVLLAAEFLKSRLPLQRETPFAGEFSAVAIVIIGITLLNRVVLSLLAVEQAHVALVIVQLIMTLIAYPILVIFSQSILGIRRLSQADVDAMGARL